MGIGSIAISYANQGAIFATKEGSIAMGYSDANLTAIEKGAIALGYNVQSLAEASVTLGKDLTNYNANSVLIQDLNVLGTPYFDGNFSIKRETDGTVFVCGIDATGALTCN